MSKMRRYWLWGSLLVAALLLVGSLGPQPIQALTRTQTQQATKAVVQIVALRQGTGGRLVPLWGGSGTVVSPSGLILTNCHVAMPGAMFRDKDYRYDFLLVGFTNRTDEPPTFSYVAEVAQYSPDLDLAVIRLVKTLDGKTVDPTKLNLPTIPLGDSDELDIGDDLFIFGYPNIGGETITLTSGKVSGFSRERGIEGRAWIKTDATIAGGNSGGTALDDQGRLVGVPTQAGAGGDQSKPVDCRPVADTNGDGVIDERDNCVPLGGFINALRPVNLAKPLIEAASRGVGPQPTPASIGQPTPVPGRQPTPTGPVVGRATVSRILFAPAVNEADQPVTVVDSFPSGTEEIFVFFDYAGFQDGTSWQPILIYNGKTYRDVWQAKAWSGGPQGNWWISLSGEPLDDGTYTFVITYGGQELGSATVKVGGTAQKLPQFRDLAFSGGGATGYVLPGGIKEAKATFAYANMTPQTKWSYIWYYEGQKILSGEGQAFSAAAGTGSLGLTNQSGFDSGTFRLELYIANKLAATADFVVGGQQRTGQTFFGPITFATGVDRQGNPVNPGTTFPQGTSALYAFFDFQGMQNGWEWARRWSIDGEVVMDNKNTWEDGAEGSYYLWINSRSGALPEGTYKLELLVRGQMVQSGTAVIGKGGASPTPTVAPRGQNLEIYGYIRDADTKRGIPGAVFLVLKPGITLQKFQWTAEEVYAVAEADSNGYYRLPKPLARGETYSMIIGAKGYRTIGEDGITIPTTGESPQQVDFVLQKAQ